MFEFNAKNRHLIMDEKYVTTVLTVINRYRKMYDCRVGNCGWADDRNKWFIVFKATDASFGRIVKELMDIGHVKVGVRPGSQVDFVFEM